MAIKKDVLQTQLILDGKQAVNELGRLEMELADVRRSMKGLKKDHADYNKLSSQQTTVQNAIDQTRKKLGLQGMTLTQLTRYEKDLYRTRSNTTTKGTAEYDRLTAKLREVNGLIRQQRAEARGMTGIWGKLSAEVKQFGIMALSYLGFQFVFDQINNLINRTAKFSDSLASVQKTTGLTTRELEDLNGTLSQLNTRTARSELLEMAKVAGKLGYTSKKDVEGFVAAYDKINVALGEDLGNPEESSRKLGKILESYNITKSYSIEDSLLKVGSSVNELGKSSTANEGYIVEFSRRMAGIAPLARISIEDILGLGATLDALGQTSEVSSTALNKLFLKMTQNSEAFSEYALNADGAKISSEDFKALIETDFNEAFISLLRGVRDNSEGMTALSETLGDLEMDGGRIVGVLGTLANNTELLSEQQRISNKAFEEGTSVIEEFNLMNDTAGAKLDKLKKRIFAAFVNTTVVKGLEKMVGWLEKLTRTSEGQTPALQQQRIELNALHLEYMRGNTTQERRVEIIETLKKLYPDYFKQIDAATAKQGDLAKSVAAVNKLLVDQIIIQKRDDKIAAFSEDVAAIKDELINAQTDLEQAMARFAQENNIALPEGTDLIDQFEKMRAMAPDHSAFAGASTYMLGDTMVEDEGGYMQRALVDYRAFLGRYDELNAELEAMNAERNELFDKIFGEQQPNTEEQPTTPEATAPTARDPKMTKAEEKALKAKEAAYAEHLKKLKDLREELDIALLDSEQQELAQVERKYERLMNEARKYYDDGVMTAAEYQRQLLALNEAMNDELSLIFEARNADYLQTRKALQEEIGMELMNDQQREIAAVTAHYDRLIADAKKYNLSIIDLEKKKAHALDAINAGYRDKQVATNREAYSAIGSQIGSTLNDIAQMQDDQSQQGIRSQKNLANASIVASNVSVLANQASSLSAAIKGGTEAGAATGPAAPIMIPVYIAALIGTVVSAFAGLKANNDQARSALQNMDSSKSYYHGGEVDDYPSASDGDYWGRFSGYRTHTGEFVVPAYKRQDPQVISAEKVIKARMEGYTMTGGSATLDAETFGLFVSQFGQYINVLMEKGVAAYFGSKEYEAAKEQANKVEKNRNRAAV